MLLLFLRERECMRTQAHEPVEERLDRRGQRIQSGFYADSREPHVGFELRNSKIMTWVKVSCSTEAPRLPFKTFQIQKLNLWKIYCNANTSCPQKCKLYSSRYWPVLHPFANSFHILYLTINLWLSFKLATTSVGSWLIPELNKICYTCLFYMLWKS